jgi:hypothetical protein
MKTEIKNTDEAKELAKQLMLTAAKFAGEALSKYADNYPSQADALAETNSSYTVKISEMLSESPRVSLIADIDGTETEVAHVLLAVPKKRNIADMH